MTDSHGNVRRSFRPIKASSVNHEGYPLSGCSNEIVEPRKSINPSTKTTILNIVSDANDVSIEFFIYYASNVKLEANTLQGSRVFSVENSHDTAGRYLYNVSFKQSGTYVISLFTESGENRSQLIVIP